MAGKFEVPTDPEVRLAGVICLVAIAYLVGIGRVFRDVNPG